MTYVKRWSEEAQEDLRLMTEAVRNRVRIMAVTVAAAPHAEQGQVDSVSGLRVRPVDGTMLEICYEPDITSKTVVIHAVRPVQDLYGDPYVDLV